MIRFSNVEVDLFHAFASQRQTAVLTRVIPRGIDRMHHPESHAQGGEHGSAQQATSLSCENIMELLLDKGIKVAGDIIWVIAERSCHSSSRAPTSMCKVHIMVIHYKRHQ